MKKYLNIFNIKYYKFYIIIFDLKFNSVIKNIIFKNYYLNILINYYYIYKNKLFNYIIYFFINI